MTREEAIKVCIREKECVQAELNSCADGNGYVSPDGMIRASDYVDALDMAIAALREQDELESKLRVLESGGWIPVEDSLPKEFVSVLGYMTDAGEFPAVRECYLVGRVFFFPALRDIHPVSHWMPMPTKEG